MLLKCSDPFSASPPHSLSQRVPSPEPLGGSKGASGSAAEQQIARRATRKGWPLRPLYVLGPRSVSRLDLRSETGHAHKTCVNKGSIVALVATFTIAPPSCCIHPASGDD